MRVLFLFLSATCAFGQAFTLRDLAYLKRIQSGSPFEPESITYGQNITNNSGTISSNDFYVVDQFVKAAKSHGYWSSFLDLSPLAGNQTNAAVVKLVVGNNSKTNVSLQGMTSSDYSTTNGWNNSPGNTHWIDTTFYSTNLPSPNVTNEGMSVWLTAPSQWNYGNMRPFGHSSAPSGDEFDEYIGAGPPVVYSAVDLDQTANAPNSSWIFTVGEGVHGFSRTDRTHLYAYANGQVVWTNTTGATRTTNNETIALLGSYHSFSFAAAFNWTNCPIGFYEIDSGLPYNSISNYGYDLTVLMRGLGRTWMMNHTQKVFLVIGQSLAAGGGDNSGDTPIVNPATNVIALNQPGQKTLDQASFWTPRVGRVTFSEDGGNNPLTTPYTGWAAFGAHLNYLITNNSFLSLPNTPLILEWAKSGQGYYALAKSSGTNYTTSTGITTNVYGYSISDLQLQDTLQSNLVSMPIAVSALLNVHGETDMSDQNYSNYLAQWITDYRTDIPNVTGQGALPPMFMSQPGSILWPSNSSAYPFSPVAMLTAEEVSGGSNLLVMAKYPLIHCAASGAPHLPKNSYARMGEYYAEAVYGKIIANNGWDCLRPTNVTRSGATVTLTMNKAGLVFDTSLVTAATKMGFSWTNNSATPQTISTVALSGATTNQVTITLNGDPGAPGHIMYAMNYTNSSANVFGPTQGARGNLRDQYTGTGFVTTSNLYNWCVMFDKVTPN